MSKDNTRNEQFSEEIRSLASEFIQRESNRQSMITITNVMSTSDFKKVTIFVTVLPDHKENAALDFLKRNRRELKMYIKSKGRLARIPLVDFALDMGEKNRQKIDSISHAQDDEIM